MATISDTIIATSDPVDICKGLALWPKLGTLRAGISSTGASKNLISSTPQVLAWRFNCRVGYSMFMGICGPAYAVQMNLAGSADNGTVSLDVTNDRFQAGMFAGFSMGPNIEMSIEQWKLHWVGHGCHAKLEGHWVGAFTASFAIQLDVIGLFLSAIKYAMSEQSDDETGVEKQSGGIPNVQGTYSVFAQTFAKFGGLSTVQVEPKIRVPFNLANEVPGIAEINAGLSAIAGGISFGPEIFFGIPVHISPHKITVDDQVFTSPTASGGAITATGGGDVGSTPKKLSVEFAHYSGFDFGVGFYASISALKIFSLSGRIEVSLLQGLGIDVNGDTYYNTITNDIGSESVSRECGVCGFASNVKVELDPQPS